MRFSPFHLISAIAVAGLLVGCLTSPRLKSPPPPLMSGMSTIPVIPVEEEVLVGRVAIIGADNSFVVFQAEVGESITLGEELRVRFAGAPVGRIKVTPPEKNNRFYAADVLEGTMQKGYEVVRVHMRNPETSPAPAIPGASADPTAPAPVTDPAAGTSFLQP